MSLNDLKKEVEDTNINIENIENINEDVNNSIKRKVLFNWNIEVDETEIKKLLPLKKCNYKDALTNELIEATKTLDKPFMFLHGYQVAVVFHYNDVINIAVKDINGNTIKDYDTFEYAIENKHYKTFAVWLLDEEYITTEEYNEAFKNDTFDELLEKNSEYWDLYQEDNIFSRAYRLIEYSPILSVVFRTDNILNYINYSCNINDISKALTENVKNIIEDVEKNLDKYEKA